MWATTCIMGSRKRPRLANVNRTVNSQPGSDVLGRTLTPYCSGHGVRQRVATHVRLEGWRRRQVH